MDSSRPSEERAVVLEEREMEGIEAEEPSHVAEDNSADFPQAWVGNTSNSDAVAGALSPLQELADPLQDSQAPLLASQAGPQEYADALDAVEEDALLEFQALQDKVTSATDPSAEAVQQLQAYARSAWKAAAGEELSPEDVASKVGQADKSTVEAFHQAWTKQLYDVKEVYEAINFHRKPASTTLREFIKDHCLGFFSELLANKSPNPAKAQADTKLVSMAPAVLATACCRVAVANGLPPDGHVLFAAFQGQCAYYWQGADGALKNTPLQGSDSDWNVGATKLPLIVQGDSATGKDNVKRVVLQWLDFLSSKTQLPATKALLQGNVTLTGLLEELKANRGQLQVINGELEKILNRRKDKMLQEADIIELLDGTAAFGKRTGIDHSCLAPVVWALLGTQLGVYAREMGSESNGRLRFVMVAIDPKLVQQTTFEEKLVPHKQSNHLLAGVLHEILTLQQKPQEVLAPVCPAPAGSQESPRMMVPAPRASRASQEPPTGSPSDVRTIRLREPKAKRAKTTQSAPKQREPTIMAVPAMIWSPAATLVLAGVSDGSGKACTEKGNCAGSSVVTKHAGKAYGAIATANVAARNGLLRLALGANAPADASIRLLDALAAIPRMELCSVNQFLAEKHISMQRATVDKQRADQKAPAEDEIIPDLQPIEFAGRRLLDGLAAHEPTAEETELFSLAENPGIPYKINQKSVWYNFRQLHFSRTRKRQEGLLRYGGSQVLNTFGTAAGWGELLDSLVERKVCQVSQDGKTALIRYCRDGTTYLDKLCVSRSASGNYVQSPGFA